MLPFRKRGAIEAAKRIHDLIKGDRMLRAWRESHGRLRLHRAGIGCPGREDRTFFLGGEVGIIHYIPGMVESRCGMQKHVQLRIGNSRPHWAKRNVPHIKPPLSSFCQYAAIINPIEISVVTANSSPIVMVASKNIISG